MSKEKDYADELLDQLAAFGQAQFGKAIKEYWFYREDRLDSRQGAGFAKPTGALQSRLLRSGTRSA